MAHIIVVDKYFSKTIFARIKQLAGTADSLMADKSSLTMVNFVG